MNYLIDLDGTVYRGNTPIPFAKEFIDYLNVNNRKYLMLTNCPENTPGSLKKKLAGMNIAIKEENVLTSGQVTASYLKRNGIAESVYLLGGKALEEELCQRGINITQEDCDCVVVGYDKNFTYQKMTKAVQLIANGAKFICTNGDLTIPDGDTFVPHTGAIALSIEAASGVKPMIIGKPEEIMLREALDILDCRKDDCCIIGDRLDTDIIMGAHFSVPTYLVLTGVTDRELLKQSEIKPTMVFNDLHEVLEYDKSLL